ncbi:arginine-glutamic acid dipeptide repeats protein-like [Lathamus discolor]|uniref:arginine-glutamic acid dipeptide repeats protein-like n=1 Tax=Lathamus discolor TaxID=678569 RepID=UPI0032B78BB2
MTIQMLIPKAAAEYAPERGALRLCGSPSEPLEGRSGNRQHPGNPAPPPCNPCSSPRNTPPSPVPHRRWSCAPGPHPSACPTPAPPHAPLAPAPSSPSTGNHGRSSHRPLVPLPRNHLTAVTPHPAIPQQNILPAEAPCHTPPSSCTAKHGSAIPAHSRPRSLPATARPSHGHPPPSAPATAEHPLPRPSPPESSRLGPGDAISSRLRPPRTLSLRMRTGDRECAKPHCPLLTSMGPGLPAPDIQQGRYQPPSHRIQPQGQGNCLGAPPPTMRRQFPLLPDWSPRTVFPPGMGGAMMEPCASDSAQGCADGGRVPWQSARCGHVWQFVWFVVRVGSVQGVSVEVLPQGIAALSAAEGRLPGSALQDGHPERNEKREPLAVKRVEEKRRQSPSPRPSPGNGRPRRRSICLLVPWGNEPLVLVLDGQGCCALSAKLGIKMNGDQSSAVAVAEPQLPGSGASLLPHLLHNSSAGFPEKELSYCSVLA